MLATILTLALAQAQPVPADVKVTDLKDGYVRVVTPSYSVEIPKNWAISRETPWGDRKFGTRTEGQLGVMTAGQTDATWEQLYRTSLYFIQREEQGTPTPFEVTKTEAGYEAMSFSVKDKDGFATRRYVLLKNKDSVAIALSVRITKREDEKTMAKHFDRMVKSARIL